MPKKIAVVLMNLGGPDSLASVKPFLFNLFVDPAIINLPNPWRLILAWWISLKRNKEAQHIYQLIGGRSPILPETQKQADALEAKLNAQGTDRYKVFIMMRYWHPMAQETFNNVKNYQPTEVVLLPLYPQFSTTTTASSLKAWDAENKKSPIKLNTRYICAYPLHPLFVHSHVKLLQESYQQATKYGSVRVLFSAHGLPKKIIERGDPYQKHIEESCRAIVDELGVKDLDWRICYQSKVGRLEWLSPSTESEIINAAKAEKVIIVVPIAFVSEHSETLVELDIQYKELAINAGAKEYVRVPALGTEENYVQMLSQLVLAKKHEGDIISSCCMQLSDCPMKENK